MTTDSEGPDFSFVPSRLGLRRARSFYRAGFTVSEIRQFRLWDRKVEDKASQKVIRLRSRLIRDLIRTNPELTLDRAMRIAEDRNFSRRRADEDIFGGES